VIASSGNNNISRSMLFGAVPFTPHRRARNLAASDTIGVIVGVNNGWIKITDQNRQKTVELA